MHLQEKDIVGKINRWKTIATLVVTAYGLLVYGAISLDGWLKRRKNGKKASSDESSA